MEELLFLTLFVLSCTWILGTVSECVGAEGSTLCLCLIGRGRVVVELGVRGEGDFAVEGQPRDHFQPRVGRLAEDDAHG